MMKTGFEKAKRTGWKCGRLLLAALLLHSAIALGQIQATTKLEPAPIRPFKMHVPDRVLVDLRRRLAEAKWPDQLPGTTWEYGVDIKKVRELADYWQNGYDWRAQEAKINQFDQFTTEIDGQQIYFIHQRSPRADAIPLMLIHGWPGSILEFEKLIAPLTRVNLRSGGITCSKPYIVVLVPLRGMRLAQQHNHAWLTWNTTGEYRN